MAMVSGLASDKEIFHFSFSILVMGDDRTGKAELLYLLDHFSAKSGKFAVPGFPHKLGLLLHGPPGTGKSTTIVTMMMCLSVAMHAAPPYVCEENHTVDELAVPVECYELVDARSLEALRTLDVASVSDCWAARMVAAPRQRGVL